TAYTLEALDAYPDKEVSGLAKALSNQLDQLDPLEAAQRKARRATIRAAARVRMADTGADDAMREFVKDVLAAVRQKREHPLYKAFFAKTPTELVALALAPELEEVERILEVLARKTTPAELRKRWVPLWKAAVTTGKAALAERKAAATATSDAALEASRWI